MSAAVKDNGKARKPTDRQSSQTRPNQSSQPKQTSNQKPVTSGAVPRKTNENTSNGPTPASANEEHVPMSNFNATEVDAILEAPVEPKPVLYKPEKAPDGAANSGKGGGPWGAKPGAMANGKDFWMELRKQVSALQATGGASQGG